MMYRDIEECRTAKPGLRLCILLALGNSEQDARTPKMYLITVENARGFSLPISVTMRSQWQGSLLRIPLKRWVRVDRGLETWI